MRQLNQAALAKTTWRYVTEEDCLWIQVLQSKYGKDGMSSFNNTTVANNSNLWKGMKENWSILENNISWKVENGLTVRFWLDTWVTSEPLITRVIKNVDDEEIGRSVHSYWKDSAWIFEEFEDKLPQEIVLKIKAIYLREDADATDRLRWDGSTDGRFSVRSCYMKMMSQRASNRDQTWRKIWTTKVPQRYRLFLWQVYHRRIMTNHVRFLFGLTSNSFCTLCNHETESCLHILRDCKYAKEIWKSLLEPNMFADFFKDELQTWIKKNLTAALNDGVEIGWDRRFLATIWWLWRWRNDYIFNNTMMLLQGKLSHLGNIWTEVEMAVYYDSRGKVSPTKTNVLIR